ncbi:MAG: HAD family hydrolase [Campylobacterales bacterium]|nr:HAD family hydrolase [Campylobacterales bacterium]
MDKSIISKQVIKGIIFDLDGTLIDSLVDVAEFANAVLMKFGFAARNKEEYRYLAGQGAYNLMSASSRSNDKALVSQMAREFAEVYERSSGASKAYDGIEAVVSAIQARGMKVAVLSNKPEHLTKACVSKYFGNVDFAAVFGQRDGVDVKPNPALAFEIANIFGLATNEIAIVGDSKNDILTAKNGGFYAVGVTWGFRDREELTQNGADVIVDSPLELLNLL